MTSVPTDSNRSTQEAERLAVLVGRLLEELVALLAVREEAALAVKAAPQATAASQATAAVVTAADKRQVAMAVQEAPRVMVETPATVAPGVNRQAHICGAKASVTPLFNMGGR